MLFSNSCLLFLNTWYLQTWDWLFHKGIIFFAFSQESYFYYKSENCSRIQEIEEELETLIPGSLIDYDPLYNCKQLKCRRCHLGHPPFFFVQRRMRFLILGRSVELKKKPTKNQERSRNRRPWYPRMTLKVNIYMFGLTKCTIYCKKCSYFCSCFSLHCILCSFFRLKELFQVKNALTTSLLLLLLFLKMPKIWAARDDAKRRKKKEGSLSRVAISTRRSWVAFAFFAFGSIRAPQKSYTLRQNPFSNQGGESDPFWSSSRFILFFVRGKGVRGQGPGCIWLIRYRYLFF